MDKKKLITPSTNRCYLTSSSIVFAVLAIAHFAMILLQLPASFGGYTVPYEINAIIVVMLGALAARGFCAAHRL